MGMNNVYYRFRHLIGKPSYGDRPARLRMNRLVKPAGNKVDFELFCAGGERGRRLRVPACARTRRVVVEGGLTEEQVHDAIRIAATIHGGGDRAGGGLKFRGDGHVRAGDTDHR